MKILLKNWILLTSGMVLTAICVRMAYEERGYEAVGGEWLILPILIAGRAIIKSMLKDILKGGEK